MSSFGSTAHRDEPVPRDASQGNARQRKATIDGVMRRQEELEQKLANAHEQMRRLIGMYQTLQAQFDQFQRQRVIELNSLVTGGPTQKLNPDASND